MISKLSQLVLAAVLLAVIGVMMYFASRQLWAEYHYRAALRALTRSETFRAQPFLSEARSHLDCALQVWRTSAELHFLLARASRRDGDFVQAENYLSSCHRCGGAVELLSLERILTRATRGEIPKVEAYLKACVDKHHPDSIVILEAMAQGYMRIYQLPRAVDCLNLWLELQPGNVQARAWRAQVFGLLGNYEESLRDYRACVELDPENEDTREHLAELLVFSHRAADAEQHFEILLKRRPERPTILLGLARAKAELGKMFEAKALLDRLITLQPNHFQALNERGRLALEEGQFALAERLLRASLLAEPGERETLYSLSRCLHLQQKHLEAAQLTERLDRIEKELERMKDVTRAIMDMPQSAPLRHEAGTIMLRNGQESEGLRWLLSALERDPLHRPTHETLAHYYERIGQTEHAKRHRRILEETGPARSIRTR